MENATKALLIAAAVLVAILIISLGVGVFTSASEQMGDADLTEYQKQTFNEKFTKYQGKRTGAEVNALLETVFNHNNAQEDISTCVQVTYKVGDTEHKIKKEIDIKSAPTKVSTGNTYTVTITYANGLVSEISVQ